jgi:FkbM family methyltransferase
MARFVDRVERSFARLAARVGWYPALPIRSGEAEGLRLRIERASADYLLGSNELPVQRAIARCLFPGAVFFDIGSNVGFFALLAARQVGPSGHVYAFEPVPANAAAIEANVRSNHLTNVTVRVEAVSRRTGTARLWLDDHPGGATLSEVDAGASASGSTEVRTVALDDLVARAVIRAPDVVKIDVEGAEAAVLEGMSDLLRERRPTVIAEVDDLDAAIAEHKYAELSQTLVAAGYTVTRLEASYPGIAWHVHHLIARPRDRPAGQPA